MHISKKALVLGLLLSLAHAEVIVDVYDRLHMIVNSTGEDYWTSDEIYSFPWNLNVRRESLTPG